MFILVCRIRSFHDFLQEYFAGRNTDRKVIFFLKQFMLFGYLQAISCFFPVLIFVSLALTNFATGVIPKYDLLLLICIGAQFLMYKTGMETRDELYVITMFHLIGIGLELYKVYHGSWSYPQEAYTKIAGVPLYSGFMYASVGSYICQAWRNLSIRLTAWPGRFLSIFGGAAIYLNFFTNAYLPDARWYIVVMLIVIFYRSKFHFTVGTCQYSMPALLSFLLVGFFIWLAENIATFFGAWKYAYQHSNWQMVSAHKISSWSLLVIVSIIIVAELKRIKEERVG